LVCDLFLPNNLPNNLFGDIVYGKIRSSTSGLRSRYKEQEQHTLYKEQDPVRYRINRGATLLDARQRGAMRGPMTDKHMTKSQ